MVCHGQEEFNSEVLRTTTELESVRLQYFLPFWAADDRHPIIDVVSPHDDRSTTWFISSSQESNKTCWHSFALSWRHSRSQSFTIVSQSSMTETCSQINELGTTKSWRSRTRILSSKVQRQDDVTKKRNNPTAMKNTLRRSVRRSENRTNKLSNESKIKQRRLRTLRRTQIDRSDILWEVDLDSITYTKYCIIAVRWVSLQ